MATLQSLLADLQKQQQQAREATQKRLDDILKTYDEVIAKYQPGGEYMRGLEAQLEREREKTMAAGMQNLVGRGLSGTTLGQTQAMQFAEDVAAPTRARMEDIRMDKLVEAMTGKAGVLERVEDVGPDPGLVAQLSMQAAAAPITRASSFQPRGGLDWLSAPAGTPMGFQTPTYQSPTMPAVPQVSQPYQPHVSGELRGQSMPQLTSQQWAAFDLGYGPVSQSYAQQLHDNAYLPLSQPTLPTGQTTFEQLARQGGFYF